MIRLIPIGDVRPSAYNPRETDPRRLGLVELSIRKLGWLLPIYADLDGNILSGHQRYIVAEKIGVEKVPVEYVKRMSLPDRKAMNIAFNRATNDLANTDTTETMAQELSAANVDKLSAKIPDLKTDSDEFYPCLGVKRAAIRPLLRANSGRWKQYAARISRTMLAKGILMPIIIRPGGVVVNGIGRLQMLAELSAGTAPVIEISNKKAALAERMLNLLSMDFTIHKKYADLLRYNSFRRARRTRTYLGRGFVFAVIGSKPAKGFDINNPPDRQKWIDEHGKTILDFGAGHLTETELLRAAGIDSTPFEPYRMGQTEEINKAESMELTKEFLKQIAAGKRFSSIFISSVLNSVPFFADRRMIVAICSALCSPHTKLYAVASSTKQVDWKDVTGGEFINDKHRKTMAFRLDYEENIRIGEISSKPKVQKYHDRKQFKKLFAEFFENVRVNEIQNVEAICERAKPPDAAILAKAIAFEFDLPYPDGSRMSLVAEAKSAFRKRFSKLKLKQKVKL